MSPAKKGAGGYAAIHANRAKKFKAELDLIEQAIAKLPIRTRTLVRAGETTAERVELALTELAKVTQELDDLRFESA